jgi:hypothetical protein
VCFSVEATPCCVGVDGVGEPLFHLQGRLEVLDRAAAPADQVVMVSREFLSEFEARELIAADDAVHDTDLFEQCQVPVGRALGQTGVLCDQLPGGHGPASPRQCLEQDATTRGQPLTGAAQPRRHLYLDVLGHEQEPTVVVSYLQWEPFSF